MSLSLLNFTRSLSTSLKFSNKYKQWPQEKIRHIGRRPSYWTGQGGKRSRIAYDKRYPLSGKDVNSTTEGLRRGGNEYMSKSIGEESEYNCRLCAIIYMYWQYCIHVEFDMYATCIPQAQSGVYFPIYHKVNLSNIWVLITTCSETSI